MGASALRDRDAAWAELQTAIPVRVSAALAALAVAAEAPATQRFAPRAAGSYATSSIPTGVRDIGAPPTDHSLFDFHVRCWNEAPTFFAQRLATYQAELAVERLRGRHHRIAADVLERHVLRQEGVDALEVAVRCDLQLRFVRWLRTQVRRDADFGWILS